MKKNNIGFDLYKTSLDIYRLLEFCKENNVVIYYLSVKKESITFYIRIKDRKKLNKIEDIHYLYTSGILGMLIRNMRKKSRLISYAITIVLWLTLSNMCFQIEIRGESDQLDKKIDSISKSYLYQSIKTYDMKEDIYKKVKNDISWMEVYRKGSILHIRYAKKEKDKLNHKKNQQLIAKKDGVIAYFKCDEGNKLKKVNEIVKKGDILVDNTILDSNGKPKNTKVNGKVFAFTWEKIRIEIKNNSLPDAINYYQMLLQARDEINVELKKGERIEKENVLQFSKNKGKIRLVILYTLLEDITS